MSMMELDQVVTLCRAFEAARLAFWVDGGWGVDALLGKQTRPHSDLDLAVEQNDLGRFVQLLTVHGYMRADREGDPDWNWVCARAGGSSVDLHGFVFDARGNAVLGDPANGEMYPSGALDGIGMLGGVTVRCVAAPFVLNFRNGFAPRAVDHHDVALLCACFGLARPGRFRTDQ